MSYASTVLADGAVGFWELGEAAFASPAADAAGNQAGAYVNTAGLAFSQAGIPGSAGATAVKFTKASSGYATIADKAAQHVGDVFTLEFWIKRASQGDSSSPRPFSSNSNGPCVNFATNNTPQFFNSAVSYFVGASTAVLADSTFHHIVLTKSGATSHVYIDGVDVTGSVTNATCANATGYIIGASTAGGSNPIDGTMQFVALYPTALSPTQVSNHYTLGTHQTLNTVTLSATQGGAAAVGRATGSIRPATQGRVVTVVRTTGALRSSAGSSAGSLVRSGGPVRLIVQTQSLILARSNAALISVTEHAAAIRTATAARAFTVTQTSSPLTARLATLIRLVTQGQLASQAHSRERILVAGDVPYGAGPYGGGPYGFGMGLAAQPFVSRSTGRTMVISQSQAPLFVRLLQALRTATQTQTPAAGRGVSANRTVSQGSAPVLGKAISRLIALIQTTVAHLAFLAPHTSSGNITVSQRSTATKSAALAGLVNAVQTQTVGRVAAITRALFVGQSINPVQLQRALPKGLQTYATSRASLIRPVARTLAARAVSRARLLLILPGQRAVSRVGRIASSFAGRVFGSGS